MCMIGCSIAGAVVIVFFGYIAMWSASMPNTPAGISSFGRVMAIILFVIAGLLLVSGIACRRGFCGPMMGKMGGWGQASMMPMPGCGHMPGMMQPGNDRDRQGMPQGEKPGAPKK
jgi:hypothetical protein